MHHGGDDRMFRELFGGPAGLGATGQFPRGKLTPDDEGELQIGIAADPARGVVLIDFGQPTAWVGFTPEQAIELAESLRQKAGEVRGIEDRTPEARVEAGSAGASPSES